MKSIHRSTLIRVPLAAFALAFATGSVWAKDIHVALSGAEETPPVETSATGSGTIRIADDKSVSGSIKTSGIDGVAAHIHLAPKGQAGPPIITLEKGADGAWTIPAGSKLSEEQEASLRAGNLYVNVHSPAHKPGEIRGQLAP